MSTPSGRRAKIWSVVRVSSGNFLEMYDFFVFGYYASAIGLVAALLAWRESSIERSVPAAAKRA
jgi:pilus assembly protein TadC